MMSVMSSTPLAVSALGWTHIHLSGMIYYFLEILEALDFLTKELFWHLKNYIFLLYHGDTLGELVNTPWTHHELYLFFIERDPLS